MYVECENVCCIVIRLVTVQRTLYKLWFVQYECFQIIFLYLQAITRKI